MPRLTDNEALKKMNELMAKWWPECTYYVVEKSYSRSLHEGVPSTKITCSLYVKGLDQHCNGKDWETCFALLDNLLIVAGKLPF